MRCSAIKKLCLLLIVASLCTAQIDMTTGSIDANQLVESTARGPQMYIEATMPPHKTEEEDAYLCTSVDLPDKPMKLLSVEPLSEQSVVHHMLLFGCKAPSKTGAVWPCRMEPACSGGSDVVLYGWGKNAPAVHLPPNTGYSVGPGTGIRTVVLQVHYLNLRPENDRSGVTLHLSPNPVTYSAGLIAYASGFVVPPLKSNFDVPNECCYSGFEPLHGFAYRVHTHALGKRVFLEHSTASETTIPADGDPQQPQGFYPVEKSVVIYPGDKIKATCQFDSRNSTVPVSAGHTSKDEMCNLYLMVYSELPHFAWCVNDNVWIAEEPAGGIPLAASIQPDPHWYIPDIFEHITLPSLSGKEKISMPLGQIGGIATEKKGAKSSLWAFHRGFRTWTARSFNAENKFTKDEPIRWPAILQLERDTGAVMSSFGADMFYMPHMISVDFDGNLWVVDTALHQAIKMSPEGDLLLTLGQKLLPGATKDRFCMPTHAITARDGSVYVADGYCNSRIMKYDAYGSFLKEYPIPPTNDQPTKPLPHSIAIDECKNRLYIADREIGRVIAMDINDGTIITEWNVKQEHGLPYAVAMGPYGQVIALTWDRGMTDVTKIVILSDDGAVAGAWALPGVDSPHDVEVVPAPLSVTQAGERMLSVLVAETAPTKSTLKKFILHAEHSLIAQQQERDHSSDHSSDGDGGVDTKSHQIDGVNGELNNQQQQHTGSHGGSDGGDLAAHGSLTSYKPVNEQSAKQAKEKFAAEKAEADRLIQEEQEKIRQAELQAKEEAARKEREKEEKAVWETLKTTHENEGEVYYDDGRGSFLEIFQMTLSSPLGMISFTVMVVSGSMLVYYQYVDWRNKQRRIVVQHTA